MSDHDLKAARDDFKTLREYKGDTYVKDHSIAYLSHHQPPEVSINRLVYDISRRLQAAGKSPKDLDPNGVATDKEMEAALKQAEEKARLVHIEKARFAFKQMVTERYRSRFNTDTGMETVDSNPSKVKESIEVIRRQLAYADAHAEALDPSGSSSREAMEGKLTAIQAAADATLDVMRNPKGDRTAQNVARKAAFEQLDRFMMGEAAGISQQEYRVEQLAAKFKVGQNDSGMAVGGGKKDSTS